MISGHQTKRLVKDQTQAGRKTPAYFQLVNVLDHARQFLPKKKEKRSRDDGDTEIESDYKLKYKHAVREVKFDLTVHSAIAMRLLAFSCALFFSSSVILITTTT